MNAPKIYAPQELWDASHKSLTQNLDGLVNYDDAITKLLYRYYQPLKDKEEQDFFEIGCYPGRFMYHFGKLGYTLHGIDQSSELNDAFTSWLTDKGFKTGAISREDVFKLSVNRQYDVVASFGFIEHFSNFTELIDLHYALTKPGGTMFIAVPDFSNPVQYALHRMADKELMDIHNLQAMKPAAWRSCLKKYNCTVVFDGYFGGFDFWYGAQKRNLFQKVVIKATMFLTKHVLRKISASSRLYSPFYGIIIKKNA